MILVYLIFEYYHVIIWDVLVNDSMTHKKSSILKRRLLFEFL